MGKEKAEDRKNEILDEAEKLFCQIGYETATVQNILDAVGIAKGTFYYYFQSKEDVLDGIILRYSNGIGEGLKNFVAQDLNPMEKLLGCIQILNQPQKVSLQLIGQIHSGKNALLQQKLLESMLQTLVPTISEVIREGNEMGVFHCKHPEEATELMVIYPFIVIDGNLLGITEEKKQQKTVAMIQIIEVLLGVEEGSFYNILTSMGVLA